MSSNPYLSNREFEVFLLVCKGISNKEVADKVFTSEKTVKFHLTNIYRKLGCKSRSEMTAKFYQKDLPQDVLQRMNPTQTTGTIEITPTPEVQTAPSSGLPRGYSV